MDDDEKLDHFVTSDSFHFTLDLLYMAVGTGGQGGGGQFQTNQWYQNKIVILLKSHLKDIPILLKRG